MIRINQIKLNPEDDEGNLKQIIKKKLKLGSSEEITYRIAKKSIDARNKKDIKIVYAVDVWVKNENNILKKMKDKNIMWLQEKKYDFTPSGTSALSNRPIIVGAGPAGLFCGYMLAKHGYAPIIIERGEEVDQRMKTVSKFWSDNELNPESNVQFGEGGAGTFSDGKLNTLINDKTGRNQLVLETFVKFGAPKNILYDSKPHIGTDILSQVVKDMRNHIISLGGQVLFNTKLTDITEKDGKIVSIEINNKEVLQCDVLVLALGHSARDTMEMLYGHNMDIEAKSFAVGVRVEHPQSMINQSQYGVENHLRLPAANYKLATKVSSGRSVYSFCMCPGGYVVNASSEKGRLAVNGMSYHARDGKNANSAIIVSVTPEDFPDSLPLSGIEFQRALEEQAYHIGQGHIPVQLFGDFVANRITKQFGSVHPCTKGSYRFANLRNLFPKEIAAALEEGISEFGKKINGFDHKDVIMLGVESRTSSPIRIKRSETLEGNLLGIYPCGEGAGYAGGITSASMDGIKVFEAISKIYSPEQSLKR